MHKLLNLTIMGESDSQLYTYQIGSDEPVRSILLTLA
jgi:hypothetical protein